MTSSLRIRKKNIYKFDYFSSDIDYNSKTDIFRDATSLLINQCDHGRLRRTQSARQPRSASIHRTWPKVLYVLVRNERKPLVFLIMYLTTILTVLPLLRPGSRQGMRLSELNALHLATNSLIVLGQHIVRVGACTSLSRFLHPEMQCIW